MEPVGRVDSLPVHYWDSFGGDRGPGVPHQPHHHQSHEGSAHCQSSQAVEDGQGYQISVGYGYASFAPGDLQK